jgi:hypothetical protein
MTRGSRAFLLIYRLVSRTSASMALTISRRGSSYSSLPKAGPPGKSSNNQVQEKTKKLRVKRQVKIFFPLAFLLSLIYYIIIRKPFPASVMSERRSDKPA